MVHVRPTKKSTSHALARANIVVTLIQPEIATLMAKRVQKATRKITNTIAKVSPLLNKIARSLNLKQIKEPGNISE